MPGTRFSWRVLYEDGFVLEEGADHHFGHIWGPKALRDPKGLVEFQLVTTEKVYSVNLKDGVFRANGIDVYKPEFEFALPADQRELDMKEVGIRLIFWRRTRRFLLSDSQATQVRSLFGYIVEYRNQSIKIMMSAEDDGSLVKVSDEELKTISVVPNTEPVRIG